MTRTRTHTHTHTHDPLKITHARSNSLWQRLDVRPAEPCRDIVHGNCARLIAHDDVHPQAAALRPCVEGEGGDLPLPRRRAPVAIGHEYQLFCDRA
jgi:hypothetical protein